MPLTLTPIQPGFAARASGLDLSRPLARADVRAIEAAMDEHAVLVFRGQALAPDAQLEFAQNFGNLDLGFKKASKAPNRLAHEELLDISNVDEAGQVADRNHRKIVGNLANQLWHSDSSFQSPPARYSMLHAVVLPDEGGETEFADMRAAYDALPPAHKQRLEGLHAEHYALHSRFLLGDTDYSEAQRQAIPPAAWPLVRRHPGNGRHLLFIGAHASHVLELTVAEGRLLLMDLLEHATQPRFVYRHTWQPADLVMWDNRSTLHRGRPFDLSARRELRRTTTLDAVA
ncbi:TauD/TfdA family dioxygenase [Bordetella sp. BOR01]|uniref:TauD/TfdA dioxygenase family protein n=1 Tax=Bordetella sp. BOR01 TaxID=2854779 RepID=UPI001C46705A|nr:TauD/TfdA family dioxygenase [Bordetella sp. BOR01]MBV7484836.1 TauD/TfdA family dioxygenase [Bordetella sp. BOR01]